MVCFSILTTILRGYLLIIENYDLNGLSNLEELSFGTKWYLPDSSDYLSL
ncbi:MAG: hypothetical protein ACOC44_09250 [Promethearchaeia archaeon]